MNISNDYIPPHYLAIRGYTGKNTPPGTLNLKPLLWMFCCLLQYSLNDVQEMVGRQGRLPVSSFPFSIIVRLQTQTHAFHNYRLAPATMWVCLRTIRHQCSVLACIWQYQTLRNMTKTVTVWTMQVYYFQCITIIWQSCITNLSNTVLLPLSLRSTSNFIYFIYFLLIVEIPDILQTDNYHIGTATTTTAHIQHTTAKESFVPF